MKHLFLSLFVLFGTSTTYADQKLSCQTQSFVPVNFSAELSGTEAKLSWSSNYLFRVLAALGLETEGSTQGGRVSFEIPQPVGFGVNKKDPIVRAYHHSAENFMGVIKYSFLSDGGEETEHEKEVRFHRFETKKVMRSWGSHYELSLEVSHSGKRFQYDSYYDEIECELK